MKKILKYLLIFIVVLSILFTLLVITAKIPKSKIEKNLEDSIEYYRENNGIEKK